MKYLKKFEVASEYDAFKNSEDYILPNVSWIAATDTVMYGILKIEEGKYKAIMATKKDISGLTYNAVDLGLPSGRLWADRNVGAKSVDDYGTYFAWGETEGFTYDGTKNITTEQLCSILQSLFGDEIELTPDNIDAVLAEMGMEGTDLTIMHTGFTSEKAFSSDCSDYFDYSGITDDWFTFNKYASDKLTVLEASDDAASINMGFDWRMPTSTEVQELIDNTTPTFIDLQGNEFSQSEALNGAIAEYNFKGVKCTGSNGNSIFIPASGYCTNNTLVGYDFFGCLRTSYLSSADNLSTTFCFKYDEAVELIDIDRTYGMSIRGVK